MKRVEVGVAKRKVVRIVNDTGRAEDVRVLSDTGRDITAAMKLTGIDMTWRVGEIPAATLHAIAIDGELTAEVVAVVPEVISVKPPSSQLKCVVFEPERRWFRMRSRYSIERWMPVESFNGEPVAGGSIVHCLAAGWTQPVGPLEIVMDAA